MCVRGERWIEKRDIRAQEGALKYRHAYCRRQRQKLNQVAKNMLDREW